MGKVILVPGKSRAEIERFATNLLRTLQPEALTGSSQVTPELIFDFYLPEQGIDSRYADLCSSRPGVLGYTGTTQDGKKICLVDQELLDSKSVPGERRFRATVAHEVGHALLHLPYLERFGSMNMAESGTGLYRRERRDVPAYLDPEWQTWCFANALLMPEALVRRCVAEGDSIYDLADRFNVNPSFAEVRLSKLGLASKNPTSCNSWGF